MNHRLTITAAIATLAASMSLIPLISGGKWFFAGLGAIILVAAIGTATRHRALQALPALVCLLCALVALMLYLNLVYAAHYSFLHLFPSARSLGYLWHATVTGLRDTRKYTAPVPPIPGLEFLASAGIGLVAALTDLIAVRLRRSALAGLPLLVLFSVPVATNASKNTTENTVLFCIGMAGYLALLSADGRERLRLWGRLVTPWNANHPGEPDGELGSGPSARALAASGRRIGLAAVVLALFVPLLIPGLHGHKLFHGDGGSGPGNGPGNGQGGVDASVNPLVQMTHGLQQAKPTLLFTYTTNDPDPQYLVEYVLSKLTPTEAIWVPPQQKSMQAVSEGHLLPPVPGLASVHPRRVQTTVRLQAQASLGQSFLPLPYAPRELTVPHNGLLVAPSTLLVWSPLANLTGISYTVNSVNVSPTPQQFAAATAPPTRMSSYLTVPAPLRNLGTLARRITVTDKTPYAKAQALQQWLTSGHFSYDVHATEPDNVNALHDFLYKTRKGYCQQFSFAMTVLARLLGIPARVAVGYDQGTPVGHHQYDVETSDEHAWTQLYFPGLGWTRWEPTPGGTGVGQANTIPPSYTVPAGQTGTGTGNSAGQTPSGNTGSFRNNGTNGRVARGQFPGVGISQKLQGISQSQAGSAGHGTAGSGPPVLLIVLAALILAALAAPRVARSWTRRRRWATAHGDAGRAHAAWAELLDDLEDLGIDHGPGETPRAVASRIAGQQGLAGDRRTALDRLARAEELASYAREPGPASTLAADLGAVRGGLAASVSRSARWRARLLPPSSAGRLRLMAAHALDVFGWLEIAVTRLAARFGRTRTKAGPA